VEVQPTAARRDEAYEVVVVRHGAGESLRSKLYLNYDDYRQPDAPMPIDYYFWVIRNSARTILVDVGFRAEVARKRGRKVICDPVAAWRALGVDPETFEGDIVITHAHWDHTGSIEAFPRARFVMSAYEYRFWAGPASAPFLFRHLAAEDDLAALHVAYDEGRVLLVSSDIDIAPGVRLVHGVGHTPGLLMVEITTSAGQVLIASDAAHFDEEVACDMPFRHMTNLERSYETFQEIRAHRADVILAGHEAGVLGRFPRMPGAIGAHASVVHALPETAARAR
jgi:glyoxylase-like metal-dependent hydrolase (beta-lactamase superfamily II)